MITPLSFEERIKIGETLPGFMAPQIPKQPSLTEQPLPTFSTISSSGGKKMMDKIQEIVNPPTPPPLTSPQPAPPIPSAEEELLRQEAEKTKTEVQKQYETSVAELSSILNPMKAQLERSKQSQIESIKNQYVQLVKKQEEANVRRIKLQETIGIRFGGRYVPEHTADLVKEQMDLGIQRVQELNAEEQSKISQINAAFDEKSYTTALKQFELLQNIRKERADTLDKIEKNQLEGLKTIREREKEERVIQKAEDEKIQQTIENQAPLAAYLMTGDSDHDLPLLQQIADAQKVPFADFAGLAAKEFESRKQKTDTSDIINFNFENERRIKTGLAPFKTLEEYRATVKPTDETAQTLKQLQLETAEIKLEQLKQGGAGGTSLDTIANQAAIDSTLLDRLTPKTREAVINRMLILGLEIPRKLSAEQETQKRNAQSGLSALDFLQNEFDMDPDVFKKAALSPFGIGYKELQRNKKEAADVITRIRTGAALNENEIIFYGSYLPGLLDTKESAQTAINTLRNFYKLFVDSPGKTFPEIKKQLGLQLQSGEILVQDKTSGEIGGILTKEYDPNKYFKFTY